MFWGATKPSIRVIESCGPTQVILQHQTSLPQVIPRFSCWRSRGKIIDLGWPSATGKLRSTTWLPGWLLDVGNLPTKMLIIFWNPTMGIPQIFHANFFLRGFHTVQVALAFFLAPAPWDFEMAGFKESFVLAKKVFFWGKTPKKFAACYEYLQITNDFMIGMIWSY